jgi:diguanylate cyclase (GGDEF)-like protein
MDDYDRLPCGVFIVDTSCIVRYCNTTFSSLMKLPADKIINYSINHLLSNGSRIIFQQIILPSVLNQSKVEEMQLNFLCPDNKKVPMIIFAKKDSHDSGELLFCCFSAVGKDELLSTLNHSKKQLEATNIQLKKLSKTDELTGCYNRREMWLKMSITRRQMRRRQKSFAILMLDLDDFKAINDNYGHTEGDKVLKEFGAILMKSARVDDVVARYGGEEFLIILSEVDANSAMLTANRIHKNMKNICNLAEQITVSIGISIISYDNSLCDHAIIGIADKALYTSKNSGKNKTTLVMAPSSTSSKE